MGRLIEAEKLWKAITTQIEDYCDINDIIEIIETQPTVDAEPVRHGHWKVEEWMNTIICSECGNNWSILDNDTETFNYCPNCGALMDGQDEVKK